MPQPNVSPLVAPPVQQQFQVIAQDQGHHFSGVETDFKRACDIGRELALQGYQVSIRNADPFIDDRLVVEMRLDLA